MKKNFFFGLLFVNICCLGMQKQTLDKVTQLINAIQRGDFSTVQTMIQHDQQLAESVRIYRNYGGYALIGLEENKNNPAVAQQYLNIAEYLKSIGSPLDSQKLEALKKIIMSPITRQITTPVSKPGQALSPNLPVKPDPIYKPITGTKSPANYDELKKLVSSFPIDFHAVKTYLHIHNISNLSEIQKKQIIEIPLSALLNYGINNPGNLSEQEITKLKSDAIQSYRRLINLLIKNQFQPFSYSQYEKSRKGQFGPRTGIIKSDLIEAIKERNLPEVKRLIEKEEYDVNETDSSLLSPLGTAAQTNAKEIALYLKSKGAELYPFEQKLKPKLKEMSIPGF